MRPAIRHAANLYLSMTILVGVPAGRGAIVLCVAPNGHVAIEAGEGLCTNCSLSMAESTVDPGASVVPERCGPCVDLPVAAAALRDTRRALPVSASAISAPTLLAMGGALMLPAPAARLVLLGGSPSFSTPFPPTQTTILRN